MRNPPHPRDVPEHPDGNGDILHFLLRFAAEAPSSHNTQPWLFAVRGDAIEVAGNPDRALLRSDPTSRELFISVGCAIENLLVAADHYGLHPRVSYFPEPADAWLVARITFDGLASFRGPAHDHDRDPQHLIFEIAKRHANREPFTNRTIPARELAELAAIVGDGCRQDLITDPSQMREMAHIVGEATTYAFNDEGFSEELSHWIRPSIPKRGDGMPGYNLGIPLPISFIVPVAIRHRKATASQRKMTDEMLAASAAFLVISSDDGPDRWVACGRLLERIWLTASRLGINMGIFAAAIEMDGYPEQLRAAAGVAKRPQIFARLGYSPKRPPKQSPRLEPHEVMH